MATPPKLSSTTAALDAQVRQAWLTRKLTDGTKLNLGAVDQEQTFKITPTGTFFVKPKETGTQICVDGSERSYAIVDFAKIAPDAGGHTHPQGKYGAISSLPGPDDGRMAVRMGKPAYVISKSRAFAIESIAGVFDVRVVAGSKLGSAEKAKIALRIKTWGSFGGGSGVQCTFHPDS